MEVRSPIVVNTHHYKGVEDLPPNTVYIGRPSKRGNAHSSLKGKYTSEECVALNLIDIYRELTRSPQILGELVAELGGKDLACWCKHPKRVKACHGDNYLLILQSKNLERKYDRSILYYIVEDIRDTLAAYERKPSDAASFQAYMEDYIHVSEIRVEIQYALIHIKETEPSLDAILFLMACILVQLRLGLEETSFDCLRYRLDHIAWRINRFINPDLEVISEPQPPGPILKKPTLHKDLKHGDSKAGTA